MKRDTFIGAVLTSLEVSLIIVIFLAPYVAVIALVEFLAAWL